MLPRFLDRTTKEIETIHPAIVVKRNGRARRIALRLDTKNRCVNLVIPVHVSLNKGYAFAREHRTWIDEQLATLPEIKGFGEGQTVSVLGRDRLVRVVRPERRVITDIELTDDEIVVTTNRPNVENHVKRFLITLARTEIEKRAIPKCEIIGKKIKSITVRDTKSRWGSCGHDGQLSFSWRLIFAHIDALDYVVAHEVAHLVHMDHSPAFWKQCALLCDNYGFGKRWMRDNGHTLMAYSA